MKYIVLSVGLQSDKETPVLVIEADGLKSVPTNVLPYDPEDAGLIALASSLRESIESHPEANTVARIAVSYGGITDEAGQEIA